MIPITEPNGYLRLFADVLNSLVIMYRMFLTTIKLGFFITDIRVIIINI